MRRTRHDWWAELTTGGPEDQGFPCLPASPYQFFTCGFILYYQAKKKNIWFHGVVGYHVSLTFAHERVDSDKVCGSIPCEIIFCRSCSDCRPAGPLSFCSLLCYFPASSLVRVQEDSRPFDGLGAQLGDGSLSGPSMRIIALRRSSGKRDTTGAQNLTARVLHS